MSAGRPLKNFDDYRDALRRYARAAGIQVVYRKTGPEAVFLPAALQIALSPSLPESTEIAVLLHELGHAADTMATIRVLIAYRAFYGGHATQNQHSAVLAAEKRAWKQGREIARRAKVPLGKWFDEEERDALASYRNRRARP